MQIIWCKYQARVLSVDLHLGIISKLVKQDAIIIDYSVFDS